MDPKQTIKKNLKEIKSVDVVEVFNSFQNQHG